MKKRLAGVFVTICAATFLSAMAFFFGAVMVGVIRIYFHSQGAPEGSLFETEGVAGFLDWHIRLGLIGASLTAVAGFVIAVVILIVRLRRQKRLQSSAPAPTPHRHSW